MALSDLYLKQPGRVLLVQTTAGLNDSSYSACPLTQALSALCQATILPLGGHHFLAFFQC